MNAYYPRPGISACFLVMLGGLIAATASSSDKLAVRDAPPTVAEANAGLAADKDYQSQVGEILAVRACVPAAWEDNDVTPERVDWYCLADVRKDGEEVHPEEIAFNRLAGPRKFEAITGEWMAMCPSPKSVKTVLVRLITLPDVTKLLDQTSGAPGNFITGFDEDKIVGHERPILLECDYYGKSGGKNYVLKSFAGYDSAGYHFIDRKYEELFEDDGTLIDRQ